MQVTTSKHNKITVKIYQFLNIQEHQINAIT